MLVCEGKKKQTNHERALLSDLAKGILPSSWNQYTVPTGLTVIQWVSDFSERIKQLQKISANVANGGTKELKVSNAIGHRRGPVKEKQYNNATLPCLESSFVSVCYADNNSVYFLLYKMTSLNTTRFRERNNESYYHDCLWVSFFVASFYRL